jgi:hypothetical protein
MKKRCAGLAVVLLSLVACGVANAQIEFHGVIDPKALVVRVDSVNLYTPDFTFFTPGWGSHLPRDTWNFAGVTAWPASMIVHGTGGPFPFHQTIVRPDTGIWYNLGMGSQPPQLWLFGTGAGVEEPRSVVERLQCLAVSPSVVTGQMTIRLQPVGTGRPVVEIHDAAGNVIRSLSCTAGASGTATATWNRKDDFGRLVPEGVYFCRYAASGAAAVRKVLVAH